MRGYGQLGSDDVAPQRANRGSYDESGSNITLDSFFEDTETEISDLHPSLRSNEQSLTDLESVEEGDGENGEEDEEVGDGITFSNQDELPRLPIPNLEETANKLLQFLEALQTPQQKLEAQHRVLEFIKGDGPTLQKLLRDYEQTGLEEGILGSYLEEFWNESNIVPTPADDDTLRPSASSYLNNPFFLLEDSPDPEFSRHPIRRAASLTVAAMKVASTIREESFLPDTFKEQPLCMDQYKAVFGAARVPQIRGGDDIDVYPNSSHVVVMCRNQMYYFQAMWPDTSVLAVDEEDMVDILTAVDRNSREELDRTEAAKVCPGVLTTLPRREWARMRLKLSTMDERNAQYLTIIDSALFVLILDDDMVPSSVDEAAANILHGTSPVENERDTNKGRNETKKGPKKAFGTVQNRWYDKLQIIVCGDGTAGVNFEHSAIDSHTALRIVSDIYAETVVQFLQSITKTLPSKGKIPNVVDAPIERAGDHVSGGQSDRPELDVLPKKITFEMPEEVQRKIFHAGTTLGDEILFSDTKVLVFRDFGKKFMVSNSMSPDSLVQMSLMLAYYRLYGRMVCVYEPVLTKAFFHGRTEAMRSATVPAKDLCEIFFDPSAQFLSKVAILKRALLVHKRLVKECATGRGVDRHLYALKCIAEQNGLPLPAFFDSEPWHMLNHTVLFAANCGNPSLRLFGLSPVVPDGFGIGYIIKDYSIHFCLTSKRRQTDRFVTALSAVLKDLENLLHRSRADGSGRPFGKRLSDIIEKVPEGKASSGDKHAEATGTYDMWGLRRPSEQEVYVAPPAPIMRGTRAQVINGANAAAVAASCIPTGNRWENEATEHHANRRMPAMMVPIAPLSDDESSKDDPQQQRLQQPRRSRNRKIAAGQAQQGGDNISVQPPSMPQRRGSMFSGMSLRQALTTEQLNSSGASFDFDTSDRSDPYL